NRFFARWAVRSAHYVSFRSAESQALVSSLGVKRKIHVCPDPAYSLDMREYLRSAPSDAVERADARALLRNIGIEIEAHVSPDPPYVEDTWKYPIERSTGTSMPKVGLNPMSFCDPRRWPRKDAAVYERFLSALTAFSSWLLAQDYRLEIYTSDMMDLYALEDLRDRLLAGVSPAAASKVSFRPALTLKELLLQMSTFDFVVTSKFHGVIFSHLLGKPVIALGYLPKFHHLMRAVGHDQYCLDAERVDAGWLIERFECLVRENEQLRSLFRKTSDAYSSTLQVEFDKVFLGRPRGWMTPPSRKMGVTEHGFSTAAAR
ncbi:MAG TPA: polysaccharide pyruvyl transferase family protein, partial [Blastocatellia bacterium]|nr:polysaccharide pyruvyl transferase family protein [Blastocatellia bacterium]